jgi:hypothetical protein
MIVAQKKPLAELLLSLLIEELKLFKYLPDICIQSSGGECYVLLETIQILGYLLRVKDTLDQDRATFSCEFKESSV